MICSDCGAKPAQEGHATCFRCRVIGVGFSYRGGAIVGRKGWNTTQREWLSEHMGAETGKELAKREGVERYG